MAKKSDEQALKWMREVCLALPDTSEGEHYGELVFKAGKALFASCGDKRGPRMIAFRIDAQRTADLLARDQRFQRYPYEKSGLWVKASDVEDWQQLRGFLEENYRMALQPPKPKKPMKTTKPKRATKVAKPTKSARSSPRE